MLVEAVRDHACIGVDHSSPGDARHSLKLQLVRNCRKGQRDRRTQHRDRGRSRPPV